MHYIHMLKKQDKHGKLRLVDGFTLIELIVTIVVMGLLVAIVVISYSSWQELTVTAQIKSNLNSAVAAMENARNLNTNGYPSNIDDLTTFSPSNRINLSGGSTDGGQTFCIGATSLDDPDIQYYIDSSVGLKTIQQGECGG